MLMKRLAISLLLTLVILFVPALSNADTSLLRELAKNKPRVLVITAGPRASEIGQEIQLAILRQPENSKADHVTVVGVEEGERLISSGSKDGTTCIFVLIGKEVRSGLSPALSALMPLRLSDLKPSASVLKCERVGNVDKGLTFSIALVAPDSDRLSKLRDLLINRRAAKYVDIPFTHQYVSYKLAVFSTAEAKPAVEHWGRLAGPNLLTEYRWYPLEERDKLPPQQLEEFNQVYFLDRSRKETVVPACLNSLLAGQSLKANTNFIKRDDIGNGCSAAVFSAPDSRLLESKAKQYGSLESITGGQIVEELKDLRHIGATTLLVMGSSPSDPDKEQIRTALAKDIRESLHIRVEERGELLKQLGREVATQELLGRTDTGKMLRSQKGLRYIWVFRITGYNGSTQYTRDERCVSPDTPPTYEAAHPDDPERTLDSYCKSVGGGLKDERIRMTPIYERDRDARLARKRDYEDRILQTFQTQWERQVQKKCSATTKGTLQLIDLKSSEEVGEVIWEKDCQGSDYDDSVFRNDRVSVRGVGSRPSSLPSPDPEDNCPRSMLLNAARRAGAGVVVELKRSVLLPDENAPEPPIEEPKTEPIKPIVDPMPPITEVDKKKPDTSGLQVADVTGNIITIAGDNLSDIRIGDRALIVLKLKEIKNAAGELILTKPVESITLKVTVVHEKAIECEPVSPAEALKLGQVQTGMKAKTWRPVSPRPTATLRKSKQ